MDLSAACDKVTCEQTRSENITKALQTLSKAIASKPPRKEGDYSNQIRVIQAALPCATVNEVYKKLKFYKNL